MCGACARLHAVGPFLQLIEMMVLVEFPEALSSLRRPRARAYRPLLPWPCTIRGTNRVGIGPAPTALCPGCRRRWRTPPCTCRTRDWWVWVHGIPGMAKAWLHPRAIVFYGRVPQPGAYFRGASRVRTTRGSVRIIVLELRAEKLQRICADGGRFAEIAEDRRKGRLGLAELTKPTAAHDVHEHLLQRHLSSVAQWVLPTRVTGHGLPRGATTRC